MSNPRELRTPPHIALPASFKQNSEVGRPFVIEKSRRCQTDPVPINRGQRVLSQPVALRRVGSRVHTPWVSSPITQITRFEDKNDDNDQYSPSGDEKSSSKGQHDDPVLSTREASSTIELLYDLFFTANLSQFTSDHQIDTKQALASYVGFFCLLWFTWLQTSLFDVRFFSDSVLSRVFRCISFGVMVGFAIVGPQYNTDDVGNQKRTFRTMCVILMVSRLALAIQYGATCWHLRKYKKVNLPLALTAAILVLTAIMFFALLFSFDDGVDRSSYWAWYIIMVGEALGVIAISSFWRAVSFRQTHIVDRLGLLTLIMLGQGVSGIASSVSSLLQHSYEPSASDGAVIGVAVIIILFIWILYFDQVEHDRFGVIKQQVWTLLHFPLHIGLLLTMEGNTQFIVWNVAVSNLTFVSNSLRPFVNSVTPGMPSEFSTTADFVSSLNATLSRINYRFTNNLTDYSTNLTLIAEFDIVTSEGRDGILSLMDSLVINVWTFVLENFGINPSSAPLETGPTHALSQYDLFAVLSTFSTVLVYFFVGAGAFLILLGLLYWIGKDSITGPEIYSVLIRVVCGMGLALSMTIYFDRTAFYGLLRSSWILPIVVLVYATVIFSDNILTWYLHKRESHRRTLDRSREEGKEP